MEIGSTRNLKLSVIKHFHKNNKKVNLIWPKRQQGSVLTAKASEVAFCYPELHLSAHWALLLSPQRQPQPRPQGGGTSLVRTPPARTPTHLPTQETFSCTESCRTLPRGTHVLICQGHQTLNSQTCTRDGVQKGAPPGGRRAASEEKGQPRPHRVSWLPPGSVSRPCPGTSTRGRCLRDEGFSSGKVQDTHGGDGCMILRVCLTPLNRTLKRG